MFISHFLDCDDEAFARSRSPSPVIHNFVLDLSSEDSSPGETNDDPRMSTPSRPTIGVSAYENINMCNIVRCALRV